VRRTPLMAAAACCTVAPATAAAAAAAAGSHCSPGPLPVPLPLPLPPEVCRGGSLRGRLRGARRRQGERLGGAAAAPALPACFAAELHGTAGRGTAEGAGSRTCGGRCRCWGAVGRPACA
jgi:hypothetical protein